MRLIPDDPNAADAQQCERCGVHTQYGMRRHGRFFCGQHCLRKAEHAHRRAERGHLDEEPTSWASPECPVCKVTHR